MLVIRYPNNSAAPNAFLCRSRWKDVQIESISYTPDHHKSVAHMPNPKEMVLLSAFLMWTCNGVLGNSSSLDVMFTYSRAIVAVQNSVCENRRYHSDGQGLASHTRDAHRRRKRQALSCNPAAKTNYETLRSRFARFLLRCS